jgi:hypothetical protein
MRRRFALAGTLIVVLALATPALGGRLIYERLRLNPSDMALARRAAVKRADLVAGWRQRPAGAFTRETINCPGVDLDFSRFTITGRAMSKFEDGPASIDSSVEVFASRADARADFRKGSSTGAMRCFGRLMREELRKQRIDARIVSAGPARRVALGEQGISYRVVMAVATRNGTVRVYLDLLGFQRGRTAVVLTFTRPQAPIAGQLALARILAARAR